MYCWLPHHVIKEKTVFMNQNHIIVTYMCEINVGEKNKNIIWIYTN